PLSGEPAKSLCLEAPCLFKAIPGSTGNAARHLGAAHQNGVQSGGPVRRLHGLLAVGAHGQHHGVRGDGLGLTGSHVLHGHAGISDGSEPVAGVDLRIIGLDTAVNVVEHHAENPLAHGGVHLHHGEAVALLQDHLRALQARQAGAHQHHLAGARGLTQDDVLRQHGLVDAGDGLRHHRRRTGSQKHPHGVQGRHGLRRGLGVQLHGDAQLPGLQRQHVGDVLEVGLVGRQLGDVQRAAQGGLLLQQRHGEAPLGQ
ncbi:ABC transporter permease subunit, partial [Dysosmobacter welbionis]